MSISATTDQKIFNFQLSQTMLIPHSVVEYLPIQSHLQLYFLFFSFLLLICILAWTYCDRRWPEIAAMAKWWNTSEWTNRSLIDVVAFTFNRSHFEWHITKQYANGQWYYVTRWFTWRHRLSNECQHEIAITKETNRLDETARKWKIDVYCTNNNNRWCNIISIMKYVFLGIFLTHQGYVISATVSIICVWFGTVVTRTARAPWPWWSEFAGCNQLFIPVSTTLGTCCSTRSIIRCCQRILRDV